MSDSLAVTGQSLISITKRYETITHNLANVNTSGFKRRMSVFSSILNDQMYGDVSAGDPTKSKSNQETAVDFSQGMLNQTGRTLDVAVSGKGFFGIETPTGILYTRSGAFRVDQNQRLVDATGRNIAGVSGPITIPPGVNPASISISAGGSVQSGSQEFGKLKITEFEDESLLLPVGGSAFMAGAGANPTEAKNSEVLSGYLERSNVSMVEELVDLISVSKLYEANVRITKSQDQSKANILRLAMS